MSLWYETDSLENLNKMFWLCVEEFFCELKKYKYKYIFDMISDWVGRDEEMLLKSDIMIG